MLESLYQEHPPCCHEALTTICAPMTLSQKTARSALWTIATSVGGRIIGVLGTVIMTRLLAPAIVGEVSVATIIAMTAGWMTTWGFGQYAVVKSQVQSDATEVMWHVTVASLVLGAVAMIVVLLAGDSFASMLDTPHASRYIPGAAVAIFIRRCSYSAERAMARDMRFKEIGIALALGEVLYTVTAITLAANGWGGMSVVIANLAQSTFTSLLMFRGAGIKSWATPTPLRAARFGDMLRFGLPLAVETVAHSGSRYWDNLLVSKLFGSTVTGTYNMAYNLADIPATQVGEQMATVLLPSISKLEPARRPRALERSTALLSLIIFPMAVGLGLIAQPLIELVLPDDKWQSVAPLLTVLAGLSVFRPITWVLSVYLDAQDRTAKLMFLELAKLVMLMIGLWLMSRWGIQVAASAVGIAFGLNAIAGVAMVARDGVSPARLLRGFFQPVMACGLMCAAVLALRFGIPGFNHFHPAIQLAIEVIVGGAVYVPAALMICRETSKDLLSLLKSALNRGASPTPG
jgi:lipopolysaccharide exporter